MKFHALSGMGESCVSWDDAGECVSYVGSDISNSSSPFYIPGAADSSTNPTGNPSSGFNWSSIIAPISNLATNILGSRYAVPQLNPGQTIQTGPGGTLMTQQPAGVPATGGLLTASTGIRTGTLFLLGGATLLLVVVMKK